MANIAVGRPRRPPHPPPRHPPSPSANAPSPPSRPSVPPSSSSSPFIPAGTGYAPSCASPPAPAQTTSSSPSAPPWSCSPPSSAPAPACRLLAPLRWLGRHSYELYLSHEFVVLAVTNRYLKLQVTHPPDPLLAWAAATVALTIPVAWLLTRFVSEPLNRRLRPKHTTRVLSLQQSRSSRLN